MRKSSHVTRTRRAAFVRATMLISLLTATYAWANSPLPATLLEQQHEIEVVATPKGTLLAGWTDDVNPADSNRGWRCSFSVSHDDGKSWTTPIVYKNLEYILSGNPTVATDADGKLYAMCMSVSVFDDDTPSKGLLELATSSDDGAHWSAWQPVVTRDQSHFPDRPKLIAGGKGQLNLVFTDASEHGPSLITYVSSMNGGISWSPELILSKSDLPADSPGDQGAKLLRDPHGRLLAAWGRYETNTLYFAVNTDGKHFSHPVAIATRSEQFHAPCTEIAVNSSGKVIIISEHTGHAVDTIYLVRSEDGGRTWQQLKPLTAHGMNESLFFDGDDKLHIMWTQMNGQHMDTNYATSTDYGTTFTSPQSLAGGGYNINMSEDELNQLNQIGSYQSLLMRTDHRIFGFWLDWRKNIPGLYWASWDNVITHPLSTTSPPVSAPDQMRS